MKSHPPNQELRVARVTGLDDYLRCVEIEKQVWGYHDLADVAPLSLLSIVNRTGGLLLGAYAKNAGLIGFVFGLLAEHRGRFIHHSHMLAVLPAYRNRGVGRRLKQAQRRYVRRQGLDLITWTFDPLQALNAHFGINKLGATVARYEVNVYGASSSPLHAGLPTDRFLAEWLVADEALRTRRRRKPPRAREEFQSWPLINETTLERSGWRRTAVPQLGLRQAHLRFEISANIEALKQADLALALDWQEKVRRTFTTYFRRGYRVTDFQIDGHGDNARAFYVLTMGEPSR
ncbi:MAG: GNAT family N-acetyltransferase [Acidobacteria bacterium]|nr:GNAT family N-acetyltransferase [Acidobacteriota bacterium]MBI3658719.1 GNAT family N-acetyltransferase [Acidobacteriota bacterium]